MVTRPIRHRRTSRRNESRAAAWILGALACVAGGVSRFAFEADAAFAGRHTEHACAVVSYVAVMGGVVALACLAIALVAAFEER